MKVLIKDNEALVVADAAARIADHVSRHPKAVLGLATGGTMTPVYQELARRHRQDGLSFAGITSFNLDEYIGLSPDHPRSYRRDMEERFFQHIDIERTRAHLPAGDAPDPEAEARAYEARIDTAGGIDLQLLGIGGNGHIGFNEPSSSLGSSTRIKRLAPSTIDANRRFFKDGEVMPTHAITVGIQTIMRAGMILLLATGKRKAKAVAAMIEGPVSAFCPASALQFHPNATVLLDPAAASRLALKDFYLAIHPKGEDQDPL
jgi:glucosamine-6-phosphate deaminase